MNRQKRRKRKRIRNTVSLAFCAVLLLAVLSGVHFLTGIVEQYLPKLVADMNGDYVIQKPGQDEEETDKLVVCLDAGHGGKDDGSNDKTRLEKDDNLKIAKAVQEYLESRDVEVLMTRSDDTFLKLAERCEIANSAKADYFVALHRNTGEGNGIETWIYSGADQETVQMAENINRNLTKAGVQRDRGVKKGTQKSESKNYYVNSHSEMPACIVELGFITNAEDNRLLDKERADYAKAIGDAIIETYEAFRQSPDAPSDTEKDTAHDAEEEGQQADTGKAAGAQVLQNERIADVQNLDNTCQNWGQGVHFDDKNRPQTALQYQEKYASYNAEFIGADENVIYLTFDEGYEYGNTAAILDTLKEKKVSAVFFVTQPYAAKQPDLVKRMIAEGQMLGNHSVSHPEAGLPSESYEEQQNEIMDNHAYVKENYGYEMNLFRFPAGKFSDRTLAVANNCNYKSVFWSFAYKDYDVKNQPEPAEALKTLTARLHPGAIFLLHAESKTNTQILGEFIDKAKAAGYEFKVI